MPQFTVADLSPQPFAYVKRSAKITEMAQVMGECFGILEAALAQAKAQPAGEPLAHYLDYDTTSSTFEVGFPIRSGDVEAVRAAGLEIGETPAGQAMVGTHTGPYDTMTVTYDAMLAEMKDRKLEGTHDMWERYISPPETPPEKTQTEVIWPAKAAA